MEHERGRAPDRYAVRGALAIGGRLVEGAVVVEQGIISDVRRGALADAVPEPAFAAEIVAPGLIDLQVNGGFGREVGPDDDAIAHLARHLPRTGVTAFLPTLISSPAPLYAKVFADFAAARNAVGAPPLGLHLEGPFLSPARHGAHPLSAIEAADDHLFELMLANDDVLLVTLAAERAGGLGRIRRLVERGVVVSLGHTDGSFAVMAAGAGAGATMATHLFNAMSPFAHREPGAIGAALIDDRLTVGLIADGVHCHPAAIELAIRAKGLDRIALVSDMVSAAGMGPGTYTLGGRAVAVDETSVRLPDRTLAGSILTMDQAVRNLVTWGLLTPARAIKLATEVPARVLGRPDRGQIEIGRRADLSLFDQQLEVTVTIVRGEIVFRR
ncbi:MAG: N-acetylglucosamine-6-phosphate deacetylase [Chloroflexota bacterium]|nr:N-acetylglucosamine-6-phosphate deacetylase [Chloroflexota bacterium]